MLNYRSGRLQLLYDRGALPQRRDAHALHKLRSAFPRFFSSFASALEFCAPFKSFQITSLSRGVFGDFASLSCCSLLAAFSPRPTHLRLFICFSVFAAMWSTCVWLPSTHHSSRVDLGPRRRTTLDAPSLLLSVRATQTGDRPTFDLMVPLYA